MKIYSERGFSLVELLVVASLFAILGMSLVATNVTMIGSRGRIQHNSLASQLAIEGLELFAGINPNFITTASGSTTNITRDGVTFQRQTAVSVQSDGSRQITVNVDCVGCQFGGRATVVGNFPLWGSV